MQTHSLSQAATLLGVHRNTLSQWLREGCPAIEKADRERGVEWQLSLPDIVDWRIERAVASVAAASGGDGTAVTKEEADRRRSVALATMAEIDLDERLKSVVSREDAVADMSVFCQALRGQIDSAFSKIAARCSTMQSPTEIETMCRAEWNRAMKVAQEELRRRWDLRMAGEAVTDFPTE
ncbi:hypothetical protein SAMN02799636_01096 [Methylobacterium sp. 275MFSha3.1]|uniref:hypothetical protein n=1 Tax=Methylobacterium sp. 275MFSha3.1 TaxID=1502746 RepID=UPI0008A7CD90|nr:hypothetical protein [Methylobacterium sp. 275MFSha3.1]SEH31557.1 hypothetical protein SAMN02799636_01096 [Methylobacterium sp. 275MFSha3.1]